MLPEHGWALPMPANGERQRSGGTKGQVVHLERMTEPCRGESMRQQLDRVISASRQAILDEGDDEWRALHLLDGRRWPDQTLTDRAMKIGEGALLPGEFEHRAGGVEAHRRGPLEFSSPIAAAKQHRDGVDDLSKPGVDWFAESRDLAEPDEELRWVVLGVGRSVEEERAARVGGGSGQPVTLTARWQLDPSECGDLRSPAGRDAVTIGKRGEVDRHRPRSVGDRDLESGAMSEREHRWFPLDGDALRQANRRHPRANEITTVEDNGDGRPRLVIERDHRVTSPVGHAANGLHDVSPGHTESRQGDRGAVEELLADRRVGFGVVPSVLGRDEPSETPRAVEWADRSARRHLGTPAPPDHTGDDHPDSQARSIADRTGGSTCS